jgi:hypothetical protein
MQMPLTSCNYVSSEDKSSPSLEGPLDCVLHFSALRTESPEAKQRHFQTCVQSNRPVHYSLCHCNFVLAAAATTSDTDLSCGTLLPYWFLVHFVVVKIPKTISAERRPFGLQSLTAQCAFLRQCAAIGDRDMSTPFLANYEQCALVTMDTCLT